MYDIIGDIHGYANTLEALLQKMGYTNNEGYYKHPERTAVFVGDFIDRGPRITKTIQIVKSMHDKGSALAVMGNHEYNAICYNTKGVDGRYLRKHSNKNKSQYSRTQAEFEKSRQGIAHYINWFWELPLFLELDTINVIHACWDSELIKFINSQIPENKLTYQFLNKSTLKGKKEYLAIETLLKGKEVKLPLGQFYYDKDGHRRKKIRTKWWENTENPTFKNFIVNEPSFIIDAPIPERELKYHLPYPADNKPVFFGHYWKAGEPAILTPNACCVDYSIAKGEKIVAYRFSGEKKLTNQNFVWVENID